MAKDIEKEMKPEKILKRAKELLCEPRMMFLLMQSGEMLKQANKEGNVWNTHGIATLLAGVIARAEEDGILTIKKEKK